MPSPAAKPEKQLAGFIAKFAPGHQTLIRAVRRALRRRFPTAHELVYDNYNFFVIGYCTTLRPSDAILSIAAAANGVSVCLMHGARLPDPGKILHGSGKQTRSFRVESAAVLDQPAMEAILAAAAAYAKTPLTARDPGSLVIRSVSAKQRPRRKKG